MSEISISKVDRVAYKFNNSMIKVNDLIKTETTQGHKVIFFTFLEATIVQKEGLEIVGNRFKLEEHHIMMVDTTIK